MVKVHKDRRRWKNGCKKWTVGFMFILMLSLIACQSSNVIEIEEATENNKIEISMETAIQLGYEEARKYYNNLVLTEVHSYDNDLYRDINAGENGERQWWYVNYANQESNYVNILICNNEIFHVEQFENNGNNGLFEFSDITLTAEEAARIAQELGLTGGNPDNETEWISGFNFKLEYSSLTATPSDRRIFLEVIGISPNGNFAHVDFDASTGELLLAEEEIINEDGTSAWRSFIN